MISAGKVLEQSLVGDSIAVNGVCLTITKLRTDSFYANIMNESISKTNLKTLQIGSRVNLERALTLDKRLGGHIVSGHIDTNGKIANIYSDGFSKVYEIAAEEENMKYLINKGSIAVNGISLTISKIKHSSFEVSIIPHSFQNTNIGSFKIGTSVNLEFDILGKYINRFLESNHKKANDSSINMAFLESNGFI